MAVEQGSLVLDRYVVERELGRGGMGAVFRARHHRLDIPVAVKVLLIDEPELRKRFEREAALMARVRHPNVVTVLDYGFTEDDDPVIVMEFVDGESLKERMKRLGSLTWPDATRLMIDVLRGIEAIHAAGVVHRDLKPDNIAIARLDPEVAKVLDFGIARSANTGTLAGPLTKTGMIIGTPQYMAPEQLMGEEPDDLVDVYAIGLMLYELIEGAPPLSDGRTQPMLRRLREAIPPPRPLRAEAGALPDALMQTLMASLHLDPGFRPRAKEMRTGLEQVLSGVATTRGAGHTQVYGQPAVRPASPSPAVDARQPPPPTAETRPASPSAEGGYRMASGSGEGAAEPVELPATALTPIVPLPADGPPQTVVLPSTPPPPSAATQMYGGGAAPGQARSALPASPSPSPSTQMYGGAPASSPSHASPSPSPATQMYGGAPASSPSPASPSAAPPTQMYGGPAPGGQASSPTEAYGQPAAPGVSALPASALTEIAAPIAAPAVASRGLLVARLPPSRLQQQGERQWLASLAEPGRGYTLGSQFWFTVQEAPTAQDLASRMQTLADGLEGRFGMGTVTSSRAVPPDFKLTPAQLTGARPLPDVARELIAEVSAPPAE